MAAPMMAQLAEANYLTYGDVTEFRQYQAADFTAPDGALLVLLDAGRPIAGGAFRRYDGETAELKRMWTHTAHRRSGHARRMLTELETEAAARGYRRVYLTTGWLQPAAAALYRAAGYTELPAPPDSAGGVRLLAFDKVLTSAG